MSNNNGPIPGQVYNLNDFVYNWGHLIVPGTARVEAHPTKLGRIILVVEFKEATRCPANDGSAAKDASAKPASPQSKKPNLS